MKQISFLLAIFLVMLSGQLGAALDEVRSDLTIASVDGQEHYFEVEVANTNRGRRRGLMFRQEMPVNVGMLFDFKRDSKVSMWMVNTYIPLDMLFIKKDGSIASIVEHTKPLSTSKIRSKQRIRAVLEVNAGTASRLGIKPGDRVRHSIFVKRKFR